MQPISTIGLDIAKSVFQVHGVDAAGQMVVRLALKDTLTVLDPRALTKAVEIFRAAKRVEIYSIGSAAPIAEDAHYRMLRIGLDARVAVDSHVQSIKRVPDGFQRRDTDDFAFRRDTQTIAATRLAKEAGAKTVVITNFASRASAANSAARVTNGLNQSTAQRRCSAKSRRLSPLRAWASSCATTQRSCAGVI